MTQPTSAAVDIIWQSQSRNSSYGSRTDIALNNAFIHSLEDLTDPIQVLIAMTNYTPSAKDIRGKYPTLYYYENIAN